MLVTSPEAPGLGSRPGQSAGVRGHVCKAASWELPLKAHEVTQKSGARGNTH